jgi:hypothetical protein
MGLGAARPALRWKALQEISEFASMIMDNKNLLAFL